MQLVIERVKPTAKSLVLTAGGREYFAKKETGITAGMTIDAETEASDFNGKTYVWVKKFKVAAPQMPVPARAGDGDPRGNQSTTSAGAAPWLPFASNTVAHAIQSGLITDPSHVKIWAAAAKQAYTELA